MGEEGARVKGEEGITRKEEEEEDVKGTQVQPHGCDHT